MIWHRLSLPLKSLLCFSCVYLLLVIVASQTFYRDPTSWFFSPARAAKPGYSSIRQEQAANFVAQASRASLVKSSTGKPPYLCVAVGSVAREGARYFKDTIGSLLDSLDVKERQHLHLILFLAHTDPTVHPAYSEGWIEHVADTVLTYNLSRSDLEHVKEMEAEKGLYREKGLFDYTYMLKACQRTGAPYTAIFEDDVLALDGWMHRTVWATGELEKETIRQNLKKPLYLRLFYTETYFGWNSEEWPTYLSHSIMVFSFVALAICGLKYLFRSHPLVSPFFSTSMLVLYLFVITPALIVLIFACGRVSMLPMPAGVNRMPKFGCCSQAMVFSQARVPDIIAWFEARRVGFVDQLLEEYAEANDEIRWALTPSIFQHMGSKSSKTEQGVVTSWIFNYHFEIEDEHDLQRQHEFALGKAL